MKTVTIRYTDHDGTACLETLRVREDAFGEGFYIRGDLGCGKTRPDVWSAVHAYIADRPFISAVEV